MYQVTDQVRNEVTYSTALYETVNHTTDCDVKRALGWVLEDTLDDTVRDGPAWWSVCSAIGSIYQWRNFK